MDNHSIFGERARAGTALKGLKLTFVQTVKNFHLIQHVYPVLETGIMLQYYHYRTECVIHPLIHAALNLWSRLSGDRTKAASGPTTRL